MRTVENAALPTAAASVENGRGLIPACRAVPGSPESGRGSASAGRAVPGSPVGGRGRALVGRETPGSGRPFRAAASHTGGRIR